MSYNKLNFATVSVAILLHMTVCVTCQTQNASGLHDLCEICYCPSDTTQNPYAINCKALQLKEIPPWAKSSVIDNADISNIRLEFEYNIFDIISLISSSINIQDIEFGSNQISGIDPYAFAQTKNLTRLSLMHNQIEILHPNAFSAAKETDYLKLEVLDLSYNIIHHLDTELFEDLPSLRELNLASNPFGTLDSSTIVALNSLTGLKYLNMADTGLKQIPNTLVSPILYLTKLDLSNNLLNAVPQVLSHGGQITELILSKNLMNALDTSSFCGLKSLERLEICNMPKLRIIRKATFQTLSSLKTLQCSNNEMLSVIEPGAFLGKNKNGPLELTKIELTSNNLTTLSSELLDCATLKYLDIRNNPLLCSCDIYWIKFKNETWSYLNDTRCWNPPALNGQTLSEITLDCTWPPTIHSKFANVYIYFLEAGLIIGVALLVVFLIVVSQLRQKMIEENDVRDGFSNINSQYRDIKYMRQINENDAD